jgi:nicotinate dehydrogenase subunit B
MAPVVRELAALPDADVRAMAGYLASFTSTTIADSTAPAPPPASTSTLAQPQPQPQPQAQAQAVIAQNRTAGRMLPDASQRLFDGACGACHHDGSGPQLLGVNVPLALSSKLHSHKPDNLVQVLLEGVREPAGRDVGFMPSFADSLSDQQIAELAGYMRARYAPDKPAWAGLPEQVARLRRQRHGATSQ